MVDKFIGIEEQHSWLDEVSAEVIRQRLDELLEERQLRENLKHRKEIYEWEGLLSSYSSDEERRFCPPDLMSVALLNQSIEELTKALSQRSEGKDAP